MRSFLYYILVGFFFVQCDKKVLPEGAIELPRKIRETSGLATLNNQFLTFNDSGGKAALYAINRDGTGLKKHKIKGAINRDWEDIAQDSAYFYIADMGNNFGNRKDLTIYIVRHDFDLVDSIKISYASQEKFNKRKKHKFDAEAIMVYGDSLLLFSKNRKSHKTQLYVFPKQGGEYVLNKRKTFDVNALITGGDYNAKTKMLVLTGYLPDYTQYIFKAENFSLDQLDKVNIERYPLAFDNAQVEAAKIFDDGSVWISSEGEDINVPFIYQVDFEKLQHP